MGRSSLSLPVRVYSYDPQRMQPIFVFVFLACFFSAVARHRFIDGDEGFYLLASRLVLEHKAPYLDRAISLQLERRPTRVLKMTLPCLSQRISRFPRERNTTSLATPTSVPILQLTFRGLLFWGTRKTAGKLPRFPHMNIYCAQTATLLCEPLEILPYTSTVRGSESLPPPAPSVRTLLISLVWKSVGNCRAQ
jgi:hypothetical protein